MHFVTIPIFRSGAHCRTSRFGRRPIYLFGAIGVGVWAFAFIFLIGTGSWPLTVLAVVGGLLFHGAMYGPPAAFLSELFGTRCVIPGVSVGCQLASIVAGGLAPLIALALYTGVGSRYSIAVYVAALALITILAVGTYSEPRRRDLPPTRRSTARRTLLVGSGATRRSSASIREWADILQTLCRADTVTARRALSAWSKPRRGQAD